MNTYSLLELCDFRKGSFATLKTAPGPYPMVVTASYRRSAAEWDIEGPAVCIPLVSSTGHGDAALHRLHYQEGKFALANLLVALLPKAPDICLAKYLYYLLTAKKEQYLVPLMAGTANVSLREKDIAGVQVNLPCIDEQRKTVAMLDHAGAMLNELSRLRQEVDSAVIELCRSVLHRAPAVPTKMRDILTLRKPDVSVIPSEPYQFAGVNCFGGGVFVGRSRVGREFSYSTLTTLAEGNFVYPKLMAWEGALGIVPPECNGLVVSPEFPVFELDSKKVLPETLDIYFRSPSVWPKLAAISTGTNVRRRRLHPSEFLDFEMPLPAMEIQFKLREIAKSAMSVARLRLSTKAEFESLLTSTIHHSFCQL